MTEKEKQLMQIQIEKLQAEIKYAVLRERESCAKLAETVGLGGPSTMPPYSVRDLIAQAIRMRKETW